MQENLHLTVAAIIEENKRFLLVEESIQGRLVYNQPAGHLEEDETLLEAAIRETLEETAWHFVPEHITGLYQWTQPASRQTFLRICFSGRHRQHEQERPLDTGIVRTVWLDRDEIVAKQDKLRSPLVLACIDDYLQGRRYPLDLIKHII